ncbi:hypothetical protein EGR_02689 [Echinococcus granulosus]|uniref:Uncharacterized protein n=1 Tax=Echinococcus granulosus TaxID=6210 RepID=W6UVW5_ECHGR|nr:hypothetical protein EGR_02689 [Echinococcus granulosus]EUB62557.1 hypothetical protein EGR_02689 [Echinococcus granulosus]
MDSLARIFVPFFAFNLMSDSFHLRLEEISLDGHGRIRMSHFLIIVETTNVFQRTSSSSQAKKTTHVYCLARRIRLLTSRLNKHKLKSNNQMSIHLTYEICDGDPSLNQIYHKKLSASLQKAIIGKIKPFKDVLFRRQLSMNRIQNISLNFELSRLANN